MSTPAIRIEELGKKYRIGAPQNEYRTLRDSLMGALVAPVRRVAAVLQGRAAEASEHEIWALRDLSFEVKRGEVVGLIGSNGAGKTTLLKILSRITEPTTGRVGVKGRVGSLLEVGTGFHPELTGRENLYLNGAILGMKRAEIVKKFDEIVAFSEIEKFMDTPVKHYSSGMYMRLAFSVAAHLEPDVLLVDEVLAVGDAAFQKKCLGKMDDVAKHGRTVLFVSHNMPAVQSLCSRTIWLDEGRVVATGPSDDVVTRYLQTCSSTATERVWADGAAPGNDQVRLHRACVRPVTGGPADPITVRTPFVMEFDYWNQKACSDLYFGFDLYNEQEVLVFEGNAARHRCAVGLHRDACYIPGDLLNNGTYRVVLYFGRGKGKTGIHRLDDAVVFDVHDNGEIRNGWFGPLKGAVRPNLDWTSGSIEAVGRKNGESHG
jgi:lipopolysaccharide transport system ATP-binding protein